MSNKVGDISPCVNLSLEAATRFRQVGYHAMSMECLASA